MGARSNKLRVGLVASLVLASLIPFASKYSGSWRWNSQDPADMASVLIAGHYIPAFAVIKPDMVRVQEFPKGWLPPGALRARTELANENGQMLFTSLIAIPEGQPITRAMVADAAQNDALGSLVRPGKVAVSFEIDKAHGVGGWVRPGDTVALFAATPMTLVSAKSPGKKTRLLFSSVLVVAVDDKRIGQSSGKESSAPDSAATLEPPLANGMKVVTVLVSPLEASILIEAREEGSLNVVLRSLGDDIPWPSVN